jgi:phosphate:Na+ symporter
VSLTNAALPMIFVGALVKLLAGGRVSGAGAALAGFGLVLFGLTTLQQGMGGLAERLHPADLPAVLASSGAGRWASLLGILALVVAGLVMTALMQSSTAAIALTLSAHYAGTVGLDQACALIIGQNIGTATSSALAAIGASTTAKRLAVAYVLFKLIAAVIALVLFPFVTPLLVRLSRDVDGVTLLAAYHTAYNVIGVAVLLPVINTFTRLVERILPERGSALTACLDPSALANRIVAVEAVRRTIARVLETICGSVEAALGATGGGLSVAEAVDALGKAQIFLSEVSEPPQSEAEQRRLTSTLHALDHASRLAEIAGAARAFRIVNGGSDDTCAIELCADAMRRAALIAHGTIARSAALDGAIPIKSSEPPSPAFDFDETSSQEDLSYLERCVTALQELQDAHRGTTLSAVATGSLTPADAMARVDAVRNLTALAFHAWRSAANLSGHDK